MEVASSSIFRKRRNTTALMFTRLTWQSLGKENCSSFSQFDRGVLLLLRLFVKSFEEVVVRMVPGADIDRNVREQNKQGMYHGKAGMLLTSPRC